MSTHRGGTKVRSDANESLFPGIFALSRGLNFSESKKCIQNCLQQRFYFLATALYDMDFDTSFIVGKYRITM